VANTNDTNKPNKTTAKDLDLTAIAGIKKYLSNVPKLTLGGTDYTPATLQAALQAEVDAITVVDGLRSQWMQQVADTAKVRVNARALRALIKKYILTTYGAEALQMLGDFGMKAPKNIGPRTVAAKAEAHKKATATRKAKKAALDAVKAANGATSAPAVTPAASVTTTPAHS